MKTHLIVVAALAFALGGGGGLICRSDLDGDGFVGITDMLALLSDWGACPANTPPFATSMAADENGVPKILKQWSDGTLEVLALSSGVWYVDTVPASEHVGVVAGVDWRPTGDGPGCINGGSVGLYRVYRVYTDGYAERIHVHTCVVFQTGAIVVSYSEWEVIQ